MWISSGRSRYGRRTHYVLALARWRSTRPSGGPGLRSDGTAPPHRYYYPHRPGRGAAALRCGASRNRELCGRREKAMIPTTSLSLADLPVATLMQQARCNIARYLADRQPSEDLYALELFRRAILENDQDAWAALYDLYQFLVRNWITNRLAGGVSADVCEALTNDAFVKFFRAIDAKRFEGFSSILGLLAYFRTCARSVAADYRRSQRAHQAEEPVEYLDQELVLADPAEEVMAHLFGWISED